MSLSKQDNVASERALSDQIGVQQRAQDESRRRGDQAQASSDQLAGSQKTLANEKIDTEDQKSSRRVRTEDGEKRVQAGDKNIESNTSSIELIKTTGDKMHAQQSQSESSLGQVDTDLASADTKANEAKQQVQEVEQQQQKTQLEEKTEKSEGPPGQAKKQGEETGPPAAAQAPEGKGKGKGQAPPAKPPETPAPAADKTPPGQKGKKEQTPQPKTLQQKATQVQAQHAAAEQRKKVLEQKQTQLKNSTEQRRQGVQQAQQMLQDAQSHRAAGANALKGERGSLQTDVDAVRDLGAKSQAISNQLDQTRAGVGDLQGARRNNRENADAAGRNADKLRGMQTVVQQRAASDSAPKVSNPIAGAGNDDDLKRLGGKDGLANNAPANAVGSNSLAEVDPNSKGGSSRGTFSTYETADATQISLESLNQGLSGGAFDQSNALGKSQGAVADGQKFGDTSLASGSAAQAAAGNSGSGGNETISSSGGGGGSGPGNSDFGHSHGKGKG